MTAVEPIEPEVSVVMATRDRRAMLERALGCLAAQEGSRFEVVVVDDASTDDTVAYLREVEASSEGLVRVVTRARSGGPAAARNSGWRIARGEWVAFTDDDCEADGEWLAEALRTARATGADIVQGRTIPNPTHPRTTWRRTVHVPRFSHKYQTCNLVVRKELLERLEGFDETYAFAGEDADLGWRAREMGATAEFSERALVLHALRPQSLVENLRSRSTWAELAQFYRRHPAARSELLFARVFYRRSHVTIIGGVVVGVAAGVRVGWWAPGALVSGYVLNSARRSRSIGSWRMRLQRAAAHPLVTAWEIVAFARASIRHRTLVL